MFFHILWPQTETKIILKYYLLSTIQIKKKKKLRKKEISARVTGNMMLLEKLTTYPHQCSPILSEKNREEQK